LIDSTSYQSEIELRLSAFAGRVCEQVQSVQWYVEFHQSIHYRLSGNLVFAPSETRELELAVIGVQLEAETGWVFDAIDRTSFVMAEASVDASSEEVVVLDALSTFLGENEALVVGTLNPG
jgi:hypothetical protein